MNLVELYRRNICSQLVLRMGTDGSYIIALQRGHNFYAELMTIGDLSRYLRIPISEIRRLLVMEKIEFGTSEYMFSFHSREDCVKAIKLFNRNRVLKK